jgi:hypothetical protein
MPSIVRFAMLQLLCQRFSDPQPDANNIHVLFRRGDSAFALLLETVQDEHGFREFYGVDGAVRAASIVFDDFQNAGAAEALERLRRVVPVAMLREVEGVAEELPHVERELQQVLFAAPYPNERFFFVGHALKYTVTDILQDAGLSREDIGPWLPAIASRHTAIGVQSASALVGDPRCGVTLGRERDNPEEAA